MYGIKNQINAQPMASFENMVMNILQPTPAEWMPKPPPMPDCPKGLEYLMQLDKILVQQQIDLAEAMTGIEMCNRYRVLNSNGQQIFFASEGDTGSCQRQCCGPARGFILNAIDSNQSEILRITREFKCLTASVCCCCCFGGCCEPTSQELKVETPAGEILGFVRQSYSFGRPSYDVQDETGNTILKISGPICIMSGPCVNTFPVLSKDGLFEVGKVVKEFGGIVDLAFDEADKYSITFPVDLSVRSKATLIGALFLIDFMYFEDNNTRGGQRRRHHR